MFKYLPNAKIHWRDVWIGAVMTAFLFVGGKWALGLYLGSGSAGSAYGAASSLITLLLWIYYSSQILLFGAEFTRCMRLMPAEELNRTNTQFESKRKKSRDRVAPDRIRGRYCAKRCKAKCGAFIWPIRFARLRASLQISAKWNQMPTAQRCAGLL